MELSRSYRPRVSRETRLLLSTALLAILALWILARVRFPDQPAATTPLEPLLTQIGTRGTFDDLAVEIAELRPRLEPLFVGGALRVRPDVALLPFETDSRELAHPDVIAADPLSRVAAIRAPAPSAPPPLPWRPTDLDRPRYLIAAARHGDTLALQPVFMGPLRPVSNPLWRELWRLPAGVGITPGSFVFTTDARLAGLAVDLPDGPALVPAGALIDEADRLLASGARTRGYIGVEVQALTPAVARATGATTGVVVTRVVPDGPAAAILAVGDVLDTVDEEPVTTPQQWAARTDVPAGHTLMVRVRRADVVRTVGLTAAATPVTRHAPTLGLRLRTLPRTGSAVLEVQAGSAADRAGLRAGDIITLAGTTTAPPPAAVRRAFDRAPAGAAILVAYRRPSTGARGALSEVEGRGDAHAVTALEKP